MKEFDDPDNDIIVSTNYNSNIKKPYVCKGCGKIKTAGRCINKGCKLFKKLV